MANAAEKGGGTRTPAPRPPGPGLTGHPGAAAGGQRRITPTPTPRTARPKRRVTVTRTPRRNSGGNNNPTPRRTSSVERRASKPRNNSSGSRQRTTPTPPPKNDTRVIKPVAPPKPVVPNIADSLRSDSTYQRQMAAYAKALSDFQADQGLARGDYEQGYQGTYRDIGLAKKTASTDLENDYASRGLLKSSLYNTALGELNSQYQNQYNDLGKQRTSFLDQLGQEFSKYNNEQGTQKQNAMQEALRRRQEKYNI